MTNLTSYTSDTRGYLSYAHAKADRDSFRRQLRGFTGSDKPIQRRRVFYWMIQAADAMSAFEEQARWSHANENMMDELAPDM